MCRAAAPSRLLIRPATAAVTSPARGNSFRLIVKVSIGGRHFHGAVTPRHFYVAVAGCRAALDSRRPRGDSTHWGYRMLNEETKGKARGRLRRIEGQVQGRQRMLEHDAYGVDILLQISAVQGALEQCQKLLLGRHIESCVADAMRSGSRNDRQQKIEELLDVFARFGGR